VTLLTDETNWERRRFLNLPKRQTFRFITLPFKVIFSPLKVFKEIAQNPDVKGFVLIAGLIIVTSIGLQYAYASKIFVSVSDRQQISPTLHITQDAYVYATTFGNYTFKLSEPYIMSYTFIDKTPLIEYSVFWVNTTETLTPANPLVSTNTTDTFYQTTVDLNQSARKVGNLTLTAKFYPDLRPKFSVLLTQTEEWNLSNFAINWFILSPYTYLANRTTAIDLASKATLSLLQTNASRAELGNTSSMNNWRLSILSDWSDNGNATIYGGSHTFFTYSGTWLGVVFDVNNPKIDLTTVGLTYSVFLSTNVVGDYILFGVMVDTLAFFFSWIIYAGALLLIVKVFGEEVSVEISKEISKEESKKRSSWRPFFVLVGYVFSIRIVRAFVSAVLILTLPEINFQVATWPPTPAEVILANENRIAAWGPTLVFQAGTYFNLLVEVWFVVLGAIAVHASRKISWGKAAMMSVLAYLIYFILRLFIGF